MVTNSKETYINPDTGKACELSVEITDRVVSDASFMLDASDTDSDIAWRTNMIRQLVGSKRLPQHTFEKVSRITTIHTYYRDDGTFLDGDAETTINAETSSADKPDQEMPNWFGYLVVSVIAGIGFFFGVIAKMTIFKG